MSNDGGLRLCDKDDNFRAKTMAEKCRDGRFANTEPSMSLNCRGGAYFFSDSFLYTWCMYCMCVTFFAFFVFFHLIYFDDRMLLPTKYVM